jgi:hypothetical protein
MKTVHKLTLEDARVIMAAAEAKAREIAVDMDIAIKRRRPPQTIMVSDWSDGCLAHR